MNKYYKKIYIVILVKIYMFKSPKVKSIVILFLIIFLASVIGEYSRIENLREGFFGKVKNFFTKTIPGVGKSMDLGSIFNKIKDVFNKVGDIFKVVTDIFKRIKDIFKLIFVDFPRFIGLFTIWLFYDIPKWIVNWIICGWNKFLALPNCVLWYALEIIGKINYLPFRIVFWFLDSILKSAGINDFKIQGTINKLWWILDDLSHALFSILGFHLVHYPKEIIDKCYSCGRNDFPPPPNWDKIFGGSTWKKSYGKKASENTDIYDPAINGNKNTNPKYKDNYTRTGYIKNQGTGTRETNETIVITGDDIITTLTNDKGSDQT